MLCIGLAKLVVGAVIVCASLRELTRAVALSHERTADLLSSALFVASMTGALAFVYALNERLTNTAARVDDLEARVTALHQRTSMTGAQVELEAVDDQHNRSDGAPTTVQTDEARKWYSPDLCHRDDGLLVDGAHEWRAGQEVVRAAHWRRW